MKEWEEMNDVTFRYRGIYIILRSYKRSRPALDTTILEGRFIYPLEGEELEKSLAEYRAENPGWRHQVPPADICKAEKEFYADGFTFDRAKEKIINQIDAFRQKHPEKEFKRP